jgi:hypothetical protein
MATWSDWFVLELSIAATKTLIDCAAPVVTREPFIAFESPTSIVAPMPVLPRVRRGIGVGVAFGVGLGVAVAVGVGVGVAGSPVAKLSKLVSQPLLELTVSAVQALTQPVVNVAGAAPRTTVRVTDGCPRN